MSTMTIKTFLTTAHRLPAHKSVMLRGETGVGKSSIVRQVAKKIAKQENIENYPVIDRRLSQMSEGDIIGLPSTNGSVTKFCPPDWFMKACNEACVLFLDELNRATPEVMQAAFQIALDFELNGWKLHPQTRVFTAINTGAAYTVNEVDPALLDRFWVIDVIPTVDDFLVWARDKEGGNLHINVIDFIAHADKWLDPERNVQPGKKTTSRRSWEHLNTGLVSAGIADSPDDDLFYPMCVGYIGTEASIAFHQFVKEVDSRITGEDIIERYSKVKGKIAKLGNERQNICIEKIADYVSTLEKLNDKQGQNLHDFFETLPGELRVACWSRLVAAGVDKLEMARSIHKHCVKLVLDVFGVPFGQAGVGVMPNIPAIFKDKK